MSRIRASCIIKPSKIRNFCSNRQKKQPKISKTRGEMAIFATLFNESILFDVAFHQLIIFINPFFHMELSGKIIMVLPERGGVSQRSGSEWKVASYILETMEQYPKKCCFEVFGTDRIANFNIQVGQMLTVSLDIDAHEFNGRWYNQIRAWKVVPYDPNAVAAQADASAAFAGQSPFPPAPTAEQAAPAASAAPAAPAPAFTGDSTDDLPF